MNAPISQSLNAQETPSNGWQHTLSQPVEIGGIGVHSGRFIEVVLHPAPAEHGIVFQRSDVTGCDAVIPATIEHAVPHKLCTRIENKDGVGVNTIEHFMAAFHGMGIDNVLIEIDGPEMPILDGSATPIFKLLQNANAPLYLFDKIQKWSKNNSSLISSCKLQKRMRFISKLELKFYGEYAKDM